MADPNININTNIIINCKESFLKIVSSNLFQFETIEGFFIILVYHMCSFPTSCTRGVYEGTRGLFFILGTVTSRKATATSSKVPWRLGVGGSDKQNYRNKTEGHHQETEPSRCLKFEPFRGITVSAILAEPHSLCGPAPRRSPRTP
jgi:hypothetical protein